MENITYQNISIEGVSYNKLVSLQITHNVGDHAYASIELEVEKDSGLDFIKRADESTDVLIKTTAKGQHETLFAGCVLGVGMQEMAEYSVLNLKLVSTSYRLDIQKKQKTYQNTTATYGDVMKKAAGDAATVKVDVSDKVTGNLVMQYEETDWKFIERMASQLSASVFTDIDSVTPQIHIGVPKRSGLLSFDTVEMKSYTQPAGYNLLANQFSLGGNKTATTINSVQGENYKFIGEKMSVNGADYVIGSVNCSMELGVLKCTYGLGNSDNCKSVAGSNSQLAGRMFLGEVKAVKGDQVQVHFSDIDDSYDAGGDKWFPYSTAYSSSDGSGFYCMPEEGDKVRVFIPSKNEKDAFVASSVNGNPQSNTRDKSWKAPGGKEILLADDGIYIICEGEKIFINLTKENGIQIHSEKPISVTSDSNIIMQAGEEINITADTCINIGVGNSSIYIDKSQIEMGAEGVYIN